MLQINIPNFIKRHITKRPHSFFAEDIDRHEDQLREEIKGKKVLVIGGAGTIGSSFIKAILAFEPSSLIVVDYSENGLTELTRDLRSQEIFMPEEYITYPFDFGSEVFTRLYTQRSFDIVACFAAHKHVRSEKDHLAIEAMIRNNVFNTQSLIRQMLSKPPKHFFSVSTDKAANPVNVMGASKKLMERVLLAYSNNIKISTARFANVAFSNGSLLAGFVERIMKRQPLSAPSDVRRYFVSPEESGQLCMLACILGESSDIFFPKLKEEQMMSFSEIARLFLSELGLSAQECASEQEAKTIAAHWDPSQTSYPVYFFASDTSGEKQYEEFYTNEDELDLEAFTSLGVIKDADIPSVESVIQLLHQFENLFSTTEVNKQKIVELISSLISDFKHIETGKSLDAKM